MAKPGEQIPPRTHQLCEKCAKACGGCNWSDELKPVEGWDAEETVLASSNTNSLFIRGCPEFVRGTRDDKRRIEMDTNGFLLLLEAMMRQIRYDYVHGTIHEKTSIENFLRGEDARKMLQLTDTEGVILGLRELAKQHAQSIIVR